MCGQSIGTWERKAGKQLMLGYPPALKWWKIDNHFVTDLRLRGDKGRPRREDTQRSEVRSPRRYRYVARGRMVMAAIGFIE